MLKKNFFLGIQLFIFLTFLIVSGCSTVSSHKDGPPPFDVDVSRIPDANPKVEAKSKYGNLNSYQVFGKRYYTMKSSKNYHERGIASWYGTQFHKHSTSSGEPYDMLGMTAAHKTLPLPTYVQVTNLKNHKQVILKVNDRGPFESNRIIDLSYVAAKKLGMLGHGTTYVDVKAIDPIAWANRSKSSAAQPIMTAQNSSSPKHHYYKSRTPGAGMFLQVGAFKNRSYAEQLKTRISKVVVASNVTIHSTRHLYHVKIGPIKDLTTEAHIAKRLKSIGLSSKKVNTSTLEV